MNMRYVLLMLTVLYIGCNEAPELKYASFVRPFPKKEKNLTKVFGQFLAVKEGNEQKMYRIYYHKKEKINVIVDQAKNDTIFKGTVCRYRDMYYLNRKLSDTTYWIHAIHIDSNIITGWDTQFKQVQAMDKAALSNQFGRVVTAQDELHKRLRLYPYKKELRAFFTDLLKGYRRDTIIMWDKDNSVVNTFTEATLKKAHDIKYDIVMYLYPNPAGNYTRLVFQEDGKYEAALYNMKGIEVYKQFIEGDRTELPLQDVPNGNYIVHVNLPDGSKKESIKLTVQK